LEQIHSIVNPAGFLTVSYTDSESPYPVSLPMIGQMGSFERPSADTGDVLDLYVHGYISARLLKAAGSGANNGNGNKNNDASNNNTGYEQKEQQQQQRQGLAATISATLVDGLVRSLTPYNHSYNYRSATLFGRAAPVTNPAERLWGHAAHHGTASCRVCVWEREPDAADARGSRRARGCLRVRLGDAGSVKVRPGPPLERPEETGNTATRAVLAGRV
jgi:uncharacterized protein